MRRPAAVRISARVFVLAALVLSGCTGETAPEPAGDGSSSSATTSEPAVAPAMITLPDQPTAVFGAATPDALAIEASRAVFEQSPAAVLVGDTGVLTGAAAIAVEIGVPLLLAPATSDPTPSTPPADSTTGPTTPTGTPPVADGRATTDELTRLGASTVIAVGARAAAFADGLAEEIAVVVAPDGASAVADLPVESMPEIPPAEAPAPFAALTVAGSDTLAASATIEAAGGVLHELAAPDPRTDSDVIKALAAQQPEVVFGLGAAFGSPEQLAYRVAVARTGVELPGGGQVLYPNHRHVALYGNPTSAALGSLGEQDVPAAVERVKALAAEYQAFTEQTVVPTFEVISSVASRTPSSGGDYSTEMKPEDIAPYVEAARAAGIYVVLDLQPGRADFLTQAKLFEEFLLQPHVGLALDPEWRLEPHQVHLEQVGNVTAAEVNSVVTWLADLTRDNQLPQKILVLHQFKSEMISDRAQIDTSRDELAVLIHVDGFGPTGSKFATWRTMRVEPPPNVWWGWKNFIDEDSPLMTPEQTMNVDPVPQFISYQ